MPRFFIALIALSALCHVPFALGLATFFERLGFAHSSLLAVCIAVLLVLALLGRLSRARKDRPAPAWRLILIEEPYFAHWGATVLSLPLTLGLSILYFAFNIAQGTQAASPIGDPALAAYLGSLCVSAWGVFVRRRWVRVRRLDIAVSGLSEGFDGYRIAHLSDLHIGSASPKERALRWAEQVNRLDVDLVALTGDYVTSGSAFHADIAEVLSRMRAKDGVFAVMGNHDYFGDGEGLIQKLRGRNIHVLRNEWIELRRKNGGLTVSGVDDTWSRRANVQRSLQGRNPAYPALVLAHDPALFPELKKNGASLVLSGHTHWGQIALPFFASRINLSRLSFRYHAGLYSEDHQVLYISPGLGTTGPPIRLGSPPEITVLRLCRTPERPSPGAPPAP